MTDKDQAALLETLAGKRGGQVLAGILEDFSEVEKAMGNMQEAAGSADAEMAIVEESIQYKLNNLQQTWVGILQELIDRGTIGDLIDALTSISEVLGEIITTIGPIPTILGAFGLTKLIPNLDGVFKIIQALNGESSSIIDVVSDAPDVIGDVGETVEGVTGSIETVQGVIEGIPGTIASIQGALTALMANPLTPWIIGITVAIGAAAIAWDHFHISVEEATETLKEYDSKYSKIESDIKTHEKTISELSDSYFKLAEGVDAATRKNVSLSSEDYDEFVSTSHELAEMFPTLIKGVDEYGNYILDLGDNADTARQKLQGLLEQEKESYNYELYADLPTIAENQQVKIDAAKNKIKDAQETIDIYEYMLNVVNQLRELPDTLTLTGNVFDEYTSNYISDFVYKYQMMIEDVANTNQEFASKLRASVTDETVGEDIKKVFSFSNLSEDEKKFVQDYFADYTNTMTDVSKKFINDSKASIIQGEKELTTAWNGLKKNIIGGINFLSEDDKTAESLTQFVNAIPAEFVEGLDKVDVQSLLAKWVDEFETLDPEDKLRFNNLFDPEMTPQERIELYNALKENLPEDGELKVYVQYVIDADQDLLNQVEASKQKLTKVGGQVVGRAELDSFFEEMSIDTKEEYEEWLHIASACDTAAEAMEAYRKAKEKAVAVKEDVGSTIVDSVEGINSRLKAQFDELGSAYNSIFNGDNGFDLSVVDNAFLKGIVDNFVTSATELGVAEDKAKQSAEEFMKVMTDPNVDANKVQEAFNKLATSYFYAADGLRELNEETADAIKQQFKQMGIINADEVVDSMLDKQAWIDSFLDFDEALEKEYDKIFDWDLGDYAQQIEDKTIQTKFGNVDMDKRAIITWSNELKETYKDELESWNYDPEIGGIDTVFGGSDSFFSGEQEIEVAFTPILEIGDEAEFLGEKTVKNYIQGIIDDATKDGKLDIGEAFRLDARGRWTAEYDKEGHVVGKKFVKGLIAEIGDNAIDIGKLLHFSGEEGAVQLAEQQIEELEKAEDELAKKGIELENVTNELIEELQNEGTIGEQTAARLQLYVAAKAAANGTLINTDVSVEALYALAQEAGLAQAQLQVLHETMGLVNRAQTYEAAGAYEAADAIRHEVEKRVENAKQLIQQKVNENLDINFATPKIKNAAGGGGKEAADAYVEAYEKEKEQLERDRDMGLIDEKTYLNKLKALIDKFFKDRADYAEKYMDEMKSYMSSLLSYYNSVISGVTTLIGRRITAIQTEKDAVITALEEEKEAAEASYQAQIDAIQASIDALQEKIDAIDDELEKLDEEIEKIDEEIEKLEDQKKAIDKQIEEVEGYIKALDKEIEKLDEQIELIDEQIEGYEEQNEELDDQKELIEDLIKSLNKETEALDEKIKKMQKEQKVYQDQIDAINEANEARDRSIQLQKAEYELQRMQNQRTKLVYTGDPGQMRYERDESGVRDAQDNLQKAQDDMRIAALQKQINLIQKGIDGIEEQKEKLADQIKIYNDQIEAIETQQKAIQKSIELLQKQEKALQKQEKEYQKQQKEYQKVIEQYQEQQKVLDDQIEAYQDQQKEIQKQQKELQKEQKEYQKQQEALQKKQEEIQKQMDAVSKHYEKLIKEQTKMFDDMIKKLEETKSKWEELAELDAVAAAWGLVKTEMESLGYTIDDVLNDTPGAFEAFKNAYVGVLEQMHSKDQGYLDGLRQLAPTASAEYGKITTAAEGTKTAIDNLGTSSGNVNGNLSTLGGSASTASSGISDLSQTAENAKTNLDGLKDVELTTLKDDLGIIVGHVESISGVDLTVLKDNLVAMGTAFDGEGSVQHYTDIAQAIKDISEIILTTLADDLGKMQTAVNETNTETLTSIKDSMKEIDVVDISTLVTDFTTLQGMLPTVLEGLVGVDGTSGIVGALQQLQDLKLDEGIIAQFKDLKDAIDDVTAALGGGNGGENSEEGSNSERKGVNSEKSEASGGSLISAIEQVKEAADTNIGAGAEEEEGTVIGDFNSLGKAIETVVTEKIGAPEEGTDGTFVNAIEKAKETVDTLFGTSADDDGKTVIGDFNQLGSAVDKLVEDNIGLEGKNAEGTFISAIEDAKETVDKEIGKSVSDTGATAIGDFNQLGKAIETVAKDKIGVTAGTGEDTANTTLDGTIVGLHKTAEEHIPEVVSQFESLKQKINDCIERVQKLIEKLGEVELPDGVWTGSANFAGTANNFAGTANLRHKHGSAKYTGDWRVGRNEKSLVGEIGPEIVIRDGKYTIVGQHGPEFYRLKPNDVVLNHLQTKEVLDKRTRVGRAHMDGTLPEGFFRLDNDSAFDKLKATIKEAGIPTLNGIKGIIQAQTKAIVSEVKNIANSYSSATATVNQSNTFNINGVSGEDVARQINTTLVNTFSGMSINAYQRSMA